MRVRLVEYPENPILVGLCGTVRNFDHVPFNQTSIDNPLIDLVLDSGFEVSVRLNQVRLVQ